jgi:hypothetical protein
MAATRLRRVGGRDDDLLHHVPLHLVRHGVRRHAIVAGGARNPDPSAGDVDDAVENAATVASLLAAEKADKEKKLESFRRGTRRRVAARVAAERGDDARHTADIALAVIRRDMPADARERRTTRRSNGTLRVEAPITPTPLARLLRSARDAARESHRSALATFVPAAFGGDRGPPGAVADDLADDLADDIAATRVPTTAVPPDVAESRRQRVKNARDAAAAAQRAAASRREPLRENRAARGSAPKTVDAETVDAETVDAETRKKPTAEDVAAWLALRGLTWDSVPRVCACPHARASAPFDAAAAFRCAANCPLYGDPDARDEATRAALRAL